LKALIEPGSTAGRAPLRDFVSSWFNLLSAALPTVDTSFYNSRTPQQDSAMIDTQTLSDNVVTTQLKKVVNWARRSSLWPMPFATACCGIELMATASSRYDLARFGAEAMRFSPRQSDLMIVAGRVTIKMMPVLQHIYQQMTEPKWVISMGACASTGGVFDTYSTIQGIDQFMPVDVYVPGCPPRPETLIEGIMAIQRIIDEDGLPPEGRRRPLQLAIEPSFRPAAQPAGIPLTVGGKAI
jgi:NADH-quinone oxidoreductase subunit B